MSKIVTWTVTGCVNELYRALQLGFEKLDVISGLQDSYVFHVKVSVEFQSKTWKPKENIQGGKEMTMEP